MFSPSLPMVSTIDSCTVLNDISASIEVEEGWGMIGLLLKESTGI
jgi:hypothetical protein